MAGAVDVEARAILEAVRGDVVQKFGKLEGQLGVFEGRITSAMETFQNGLGQAKSSNQDIAR